MTALSQEILENWQVRKTKKQKTAFIQFMQQKLPGLTVEQGGFGGNRNLVLGDVKSAKLILTAHYDTCARLPFPNFITPKNMLFYLGYQLLIMVPFLLLGFGLMGLLMYLGMDFFISYYLGFLAMFGSMIYLFMLGPANPHTANDNTSGVIALCEIYAALTEEQRQKVCFIFFDNEENGLLGSSFYKSRHKKDGVDGKLLLNFDCVSDGDHILLAMNKQVKKQHGQILEQCFASWGEKAVMHETSAFYPSDQSQFKLGVGVAALKYKKPLGYYMDRIHTKRDTAFDERNIDLLKRSTVKLAEHL